MSKSKDIKVNLKELKFGVIFWDFRDNKFAESEKIFIDVTELSKEVGVDYLKPSLVIEAVVENFNQ